MNESDPMDSTLGRWKKYSEMTELGEIARRYFVMNFFDGVLTVLGVLIGYFTLYLTGIVKDSSAILIPSISVSVAIGISGISGGYLAEKAERRAEINDMKRAMAMQTEVKMVLDTFSSEEPKLKQEDYYPKIAFKKTDSQIQRVEVDPSTTTPTKTSQEGPKDKTLAEKAQAFATNVASGINGAAPAAGGLICVIPLFFVEVPSVWTYVSCFAVIIVTLFLLGGYLAKISEDTIWKYGPAMILAGVITSLLSLLLGV